MSERIPHAGDIVWVVFDPVIGTEQEGRRPALVLTEHEFNKNSQRSIVCPITNAAGDWPTLVPVPENCMKVTGYVMADQIRSVHRKGRCFRFIEPAPDTLLVEVRAVVGALTGVNSL